MKIAIAARNFERPLVEELGPRLLEQHQRLFIYDGSGAAPVWAQNLWSQPEKFAFESISQAAKHLRGVQRNWWLHSIGQHRRAQLIQEQLPHLKPKALEFPATAPASPLGSYTLLDTNTLLYSAACSSPFADGEVEFVENKTDPPSRAYLKLWEAFTLLGVRPEAGGKVLDLGSSPGGWTWVLDRLGCEVTSVDKAPLDAKLKLSARVKFLSESAFALEPSAVGPLDWLFSDVICYPDKLLATVRRWLEAGTVRNFLCTLKFQGPTDFATIREFAAISGSRLMHLHNNKHELTWVRLSTPQRRT